jgi:2-polyprenyl-3-methyl-5-hydroxy-6-metoxy-1,4-benzoquinol methylase
MNTPTKAKANFQHVLPAANLIKGRHPFIVDFCRDKKVLHIGCVDAGIMEERFQNNELLHQKLAQVSPFLYGVDIDVEGIEFLKNNGFDNLWVMDICDPKQQAALANIQFDVIILSEVIEHLNNPGFMLDAIKQLMTKETALLISVPNAFAAKNIWNMIKRQEYVHPDHNYYFSHVTFANVLTKSGLAVQENYIYAFNPVAFKRSHNIVKSSYWYLHKRFEESSANWLLFLKNIGLDFVNDVKALPENLLSWFLYKRSGFFGDGLMAICKLSERN